MHCSERYDKDSETYWEFKGKVSKHGENGKHSRLSLAHQSRKSRGSPAEDSRRSDSRKRTGRPGHIKNHSAWAPCSKGSILKELGAFELRIGNIKSKVLRRFLHQSIVGVRVIMSPPPIAIFLVNFCHCNTWFSGRHTLACLQPKTMYPPTTTTNCQHNLRQLYQGVHFAKDNWLKNLI